MATSTINNYTGNGTTDSFLVGFDYLRKSFVEVYLDELLQELGVDYEFSTDNVITFGTAPAIGVDILIMRNTLVKETIVSYIDPAILSASDLNKSFTQPIHLIQELKDDVSELEINKDINGNLDLGGTRVVNSGQPVNDNDLATKIYVDTNDDALRDFIESVDKDLLSLTGDIDDRISALSVSFNTTINNSYNRLTDSIDDLTDVVNNNDANINNLLSSYVDLLQGRIDAIDVAGVKISADAGNAIEVKGDGLFVQDLSTSVNDLSDIVVDNLVPNLADITTRVNGLDNDSVAQWVIINDTSNRVNTNTSNISSNSGRITTNSNNIDGLDTRVTSLELNQNAPTSGGGFNTIEYITTSNSAYIPPVTGWYKITIVGGGGGGGGSSNYYSSLGGGSGGGGGAAGKAKVIYQYLAQDDLISITIGSYGAGGATGGTTSNGGAGGTGGTTIITINGVTYSIGGGTGGGGGERMVRGGYGGTGGGGIGEVANAGDNGQIGNYLNSVYGGGNGGNGGSNGTPYGSGGGGAGGAGAASSTGYGGRMGGYGAADGGGGVTASGSVGGRGATGAIMLEYYDTNL